MPKLPIALQQLPPSTTAALETLGSHLAVARVRRRASLAAWAKRMGVSVPTLTRMEAGDPSVSIGLYATALWLIGRDSTLATLAAPEHDTGALEMEVGKAIELGKSRMVAAHQAAATRKARKP